MAIYGLEETDEEKKKKLQMSAAQGMLNSGGGGGAPASSGGMVFAGGTPWFDESTGTQRTPEQVSQMTGVPIEQLTVPAVPGVDPNAPTGFDQQKIAQYGLTGDFAREELGLRRNLSDLDLQRQRGLSRAAQDFSNTLSRSATAQQRAAQQLQESMASRGLMKSGINLQSSAQQEQDYQQYIADLASQRARRDEDIESAYGTAQRDYYGQVEKIYGRQVQAEIDRKLAEEKAKAEARAKQEQAAMQQRMLEEIAKAQQAARDAAVIAAQAAAARQTLQMPDTPGLGGGGGFIDSGQYMNPNMRIALPSLAQGSNMNSVQQWVIQNLAPSLAGDVVALPAVASALVNAGGQGLTVDQLRTLISNVRNNYGVL